MDSEIIIYSIYIAALLLMSGFFSGSETGVTAASRAKLYNLQKRGDWRGKMVNSLKSNQESTIGAILLGNNLVNILASALATSFAIRMWGEDSVFLVTIVMTALVLIFAELMPKTYAINNPEKVSVFVSPLLYVVVKIFAPITSAVQKLIDILFKLLGLNKISDEESSGQDEIKETIELKHFEGDVQKSEKLMLGSILELNDINVADVMVHRKNMEMLNLDQAPEKIIMDATKSSHSRLPIYKGKEENIVGVIHMKDILRLSAREKNVSADMLEKAANKPWFIPESTSLREQLFAFRRRRKHFAMVVDEYGDLLGVVTLEDILEEIVGEIDDEHDAVDSQEIYKISDGLHLISGEATIRDINRALDLDLPDENASTLAGLLLYESRQIPEEKAIFEFFGYRFEVKEKDGNQMTKILLYTK